MTASTHPEPARRPDPLWLYVLIAGLVPVVLLAVQGQRLDGDTYHYIEYWHKLLGGVAHESSLHEAAPKALPIVVFGAAWDLTHSFVALSLLSIGLGALAVAWMGRALHGWVGRGAARLAVLLIALHPLLVAGMLEGSSAVLELFFLAAALVVAAGGGRRAALYAGLLLLCAGVCRPDLWPLPYLVLPWLVLWPAARAGRRGVGLALGIAALAPLLWLGFDALLTGDALFSFRDTADYSNRHLSSEVRPSLVGATFAYGRRWVTTFLAAAPGASLVLAGAGAVLLLRKRPRAAVGLAMVLLSVAGFYLLPFRSGLPLLPRFLLIPICIANLLAGVGLVSLIGVCRRPRSEPGAGLALSGLVVTLLLSSLAVLHSLDGLRRWSTGMGAFHAYTTEHFTQVVEWVGERERREDYQVMVPARRKGLAVLLLGLSSDQVTSFERQLQSDAPSFHERFDYLVYQEDDLGEPYASIWRILVEPPAGYEELSPPFDSPGLHIYARADVPR